MRCVILTLNFQNLLRNGTRVSVLLQDLKIGSSRVAWRLINSRGKWGCLNRGLVESVNPAPKLKSQVLTYLHIFALPKVVVVHTE